MNKTLLNWNLAYFFGSKNYYVMNMKATSALYSLFLYSLYVYMINNGASEIIWGFC